MYNDTLVYKVGIWVFFWVILWKEKEALKYGVCFVTSVLRKWANWEVNIYYCFDMISNTVDSQLFASKIFALSAQYIYYVYSWHGSQLVLRENQMSLAYGAILHELGAQQCHTRLEVECGAAGLPTHGVWPYAPRTYFLFIFCKTIPHGQNTIPHGQEGLINHMMHSKLC